MSEYLVRPRHLPFDFLQRRPHPGDMRGPASVGVEPGQVVQIPLDVRQADVNMLVTLHFAASLATYRCTPA